MNSLSVEELKEWYDTGKDFAIIDIREKEEWIICRLPEAELIPMGKIPHNLEKITNDKPVVIYCHHGIRSLRVVMYLEIRGYSQVYNLMDGIDAWALRVDREMKRY